MGRGWRICARATTTGTTAGTAAEATPPEICAARAATAGTAGGAQPAQHGPQQPLQGSGVPECPVAWRAPAQGADCPAMWCGAPEAIAIAPCPASIAASASVARGCAAAAAAKQAAAITARTRRSRRDATGRTSGAESGNLRWRMMGSKSRATVSELEPRPERALRP